jgi:hypothetical protein
MTVKTVGSLLDRMASSHDSRLLPLRKLRNATIQVMPSKTTPSARTALFT